MIRIISHLSTACRDERGAVMPILMMISSIMLVSGVAFLSVSAFDAQAVQQSASHVQARYFAEEAVRQAMWRIETTDPATWATWVNFSDSTHAASYDAQNQIVTGVGFYGGVTDTIAATVSLDTLDVQKQLGHIILYRKALELGGNVTLIHQPENGPKRIRGYRIMRLRHALYQPRRFFVRVFRFLFFFWRLFRHDMLRVYFGTQTFDSPMQDGLHFVFGNVNVRDGMTLNGSLAATGLISFSGRSTINATQVPEDSPRYPAYFPALSAMRGSDAEQELKDDTEDMRFNASPSGHPLDVNINGLVFSRRKIHLDNLTMSGIMVARIVDLGGNTTFTFDSKYRYPPPPDIEIADAYIPKLIVWKESN